VTVATDGFDRYPSVLADLERRRGPLNVSDLDACVEEVFRGDDSGDILDLRPAEQKRRLFGYKQEVWTNFGYSLSYLEGMKSQSFWDEEFSKIAEIDSKLVKAREM